MAEDAGRAQVRAELQRLASRRATYDSDPSPSFAEEAEHFLAPWSEAGEAASGPPLAAGITWLDVPGPDNGWVDSGSGASGSYDGGGGDSGGGGSSDDF